MSRQCDERIALVVCDLDGTLLDGDETLPRGICGIAQELRRAGVCFSVATGRNITQAENHIRLLGVEIPCVFLNGAMVATPEETLWSKALPQEAVAGIMDRLRGSMASVVFNSERENKVLRETEWVLAQQRDHNRFHDVITGKEAASERFFKINVVDENSQGIIPETADWLAARYPDLLECTLYGGREMEIVPASCNKASATRMIADALDIAMKNVLFIGDNNNDIEAVRQAGIGVSVGNGSSELKSIADYVCQNHHMHGVKEAVRLFCGVH